MNIQKKENGKWRIRQMSDGKTYSITVDHKPTKREAELLMAELIDKKKIYGNTNATFKAAADDYNNSKSNVLSPATIRGYKIMARNLPEWFQEKKLAEIDSVTVQKLINKYSLDHSPKSAHNLYGFIKAVFNVYCPNVRIDVTLPKKAQEEPYIPTKDEMIAILDAVKGTKYQCAFELAAMGLRRSEIVAVTPEDVSDDNVLTINKAKVYDEDNNLILKNVTKTKDSNRQIIIPQELADLIRSQGYVYNEHLNGLNDKLHRIQDNLGIQRFSFHKMRHFFASYCHNDLKLSDRQIESIGGWSKGSPTLKKVYSHVMEQEEAKKKVAESIGSLFIN